MADISTLLLYNTINFNNLQGNKYSFTIQKLPHITYFGNAVNLPGVQTSPAPVDSYRTTMFRHGDTLDYEPLAIRFIVDEEFKAWKEAYDWMRGLTTPKSHSEYIPKLEDRYSDATLLLHNNSNEEFLKIKFFDCHPIALSGINFEIYNEETTVLTADLVLRYDMFEFEPLNRG